MSVHEPSKLSKPVADARAVEGPALSINEPGKLSKSVADARAVEGPAMYVDEPSELSSVAATRTVEGPALSVDEPSERLKSVADARAVEGLCFFRLACFHFAAGKAASPVVNDVKQLSVDVRSRCKRYVRAGEAQARVGRVRRVVQASESRGPCGRADLCRGGLELGRCRGGRVWPDPHRCGARVGMVVRAREALRGLVCSVTMRGPRVWSAASPHPGVP